MLAMLARNFILCKRQVLLGVIYIVLYSFLFSSASMVIAGSLFVGLYLYSITLFSFEERAHALSMNKSLPVSNGTIVAAYYLASAVYALALLLISLGALSIVIRFGLKPMVMPALSEIGADVLLFAVVLSVQMPLIIKFGAVKLRWINLFILAGGIALAGVMDQLEMPAFAIRLEGIPAVLISTGAAALLCMISYLISVRIYDRKESD